MEEDFPALPGALSGQGPNNSLMTGGAGAPGMVEQFQRMKMESQSLGDGGSQLPGSGGPSGAVQGDKPDRYGMLGLLSVIRMMDDNLNTLALGTDLTLLGLNLNASDNLYESFVSPWADSRVSRSPEYVLPRCYYISPPALKTVFFQKFCDMTLFYIFYHFLTRPSDAQHQELRASLVKYAYQELLARGWQFQQESNIWVTRVQGGNEFKYFDMQAMELRPFLGQPPPQHTPPAESH